MCIRTKFAALLLALPLLAACEESADQAKGPPMPHVDVQAVKALSRPLVMEYPGRVAGYKSVEVRARVEGILLSREYQEGSVVKEGDVLFLIDPAPYESELESAKARLGQEKANLKRAERSWERIRSLHKQGTVSAQRRDEALADLETARSLVQDAAAKLETAELNLSYTTVRAPITGATGREEVSEGSLIGTGPDRSLLTTMTQLDPVYVNFSYAATEAASLRQQIVSGRIEEPENERYSVRVRFGSGEYYAGEGYVDFTDNTVDTSTGTIRARAILGNPDGVLVPGQFVTLLVSGLTIKDAIAIPKRALMQAADGAYVYVIGEDNKAIRRSVTLGEELDDLWVIKAGLKAGERIVTEGVVKVHPGTQVVIDNGPGAVAPEDNLAKESAGAEKKVAEEENGTAVQ
jgi:membrane fusion protein (multidrug efflux system)